jgi:hypothetical protein
MRSSSAILDDMGAYLSPNSCGLGLCPVYQARLIGSRLERPVGSQTLGDLIQGYRQSRDFAAKAKRTRRDYDEHLAHLNDIWGKMPLDVLDDQYSKGH